MRDFTYLTYLYISDLPETLFDVPDRLDVTEIPDVPDITDLPNALNIPDITEILTDILEILTDIPEILTDISEKPDVPDIPEL